MKKNLLLIAALGTILLVSCGNSNNNVTPYGDKFLKVCVLQEK